MNLFDYLSAHPVWALVHLTVGGFVAGRVVRAVGELVDRWRRNP